MQSFPEHVEHFKILIVKIDENLLAGRISFPFKTSRGKPLLIYHSKVSKGMKQLLTLSTGGARTNTNRKVITGALKRKVLTWRDDVSFCVFELTLFHVWGNFMLLDGFFFLSLIFVFNCKYETKTLNVKETLRFWSSWVKTWTFLTFRFSSFLH